MCLCKKFLVFFTLNSCLHFTFAISSSQKNQIKLLRPTCQEKHIFSIYINNFQTLNSLFPNNKNNNNLMRATDGFLVRPRWILLFFLLYRGNQMKNNNKSKSTFFLWICFFLFVYLLFYYQSNLELL